ncbi:hypothetical protein ROZALSC1DRAFT_22730 [Rozella allomycis CSF55]|uniref:Uncharacterized protein n=1 Tax=Rozella allomycis (strain CSF55) TaxID=988480 RepID=A0A4P9YHE6_ROZAC|nr:hypothetical protein ROZALSC1DRAFT_22730 [Rozella allomycis CSF55]
MTLHDTDIIHPTGRGDRHHVNVLNLVHHINTKEIIAVDFPLRATVCFELNPFAVENQIAQGLYILRAFFVRPQILIFGLSQNTGHIFVAHCFDSFYYQAPETQVVLILCKIVRDNIRFNICARQELVKDIVKKRMQRPGRILHPTQYIIHISNGPLLRHTIRLKLIGEQYLQFYVAAQ